MPRRGGWSLLAGVGVGRGDDVDKPVGIALTLVDGKQVTVAATFQSIAADHTAEARDLRLQRVDRRIGSVAFVDRIDEHVLGDNGATVGEQDRSQRELLAPSDRCAINFHGAEHVELHRCQDRTVGARRLVPICKETRNGLLPPEPSAGGSSGGERGRRVSGMSNVLIAAVGAVLTLGSIAGCSGSDGSDDDVETPVGGINGPARVDPDAGVADNSEQDD